MLEIDTAARATRKALRTLFPNRKYSLASLKDPLRLYDTWVFRCIEKPRGGSVVCKISSADIIGREKIKNQYERLRNVRVGLNNSEFSAPQAIEIIENQSAFFMEDIKGQSVLQSILMLPSRGDADDILQKSGKWLSYFHKLTMSADLFEPKPHINWLRRKILSAGSADNIPCLEELFGEFKKLERLSQNVRGLTSVRCVTHRDFHLRNILLGESGAVYGIDFENGKEDDALRDVSSFIFDFALRCRDRSMMIDEIKKPANHFWNAYSDTITHPLVTEFFQKFSALNMWSNMRNNANVSTFNDRKLELLMVLSKTPLIA